MSKANQKFVQADEAVSPVIGVILMVAITVVLAAVVFVLVSNLSKGGSESAPDVNFAVTTDNTNNDIIIQHRTGETIRDGEMKISIRAIVNGQAGNPTYVTCTTGDFTAGSEIRAFMTTNTSTATTTSTPVCNAGNGTVWDTSPSQGANCLATPGECTTLVNGDYRVVIFHIKSSSIMLDEQVTIS